MRRIFISVRTKISVPALVAGMILSSVAAYAKVAVPSFLSAYNVGYVTMENGLPHNFVDDIFRDSRGFMWIGLGAGLARYDGREFIYFNPTSEEFLLPGSFTVEIAEDPFNRLWVATDGGLSIIDIFSLSQVFPDDRTGALLDVINKPASAVFKDAFGRMWVRSDSRITCLRFDDEGVVADAAVSDVSGSHNSPLVMRDVYSDGKPWTKIGDVVCQIVPDFESGTVSVTPVDDCLRFGSETTVFDMVLHGSEIWIATDSGLYRYNPAESIAKRYVNNPQDTTSISQNFVNTLAITPDKRIMAGTLQGVNVYNPISDSFERIQQPVAFRPGSLSNNFINKIFVDGDRIWIGTEGCGLNRLSPKRLSVSELMENFSTPGLSFNTPVNAILSEKDGTVWIGTVEGGLHMTDCNFDSFRHFNTSDGSLAHNSVSDIERDGRGLLWVGTWGGGVSVLREGPSHSLSRVRTITETSDRLKHLGYIGGLEWDSINNMMWIGASRGLFTYDYNTDSIQEVYPDATDDIFGVIGSAIDSEGHMWIGTSKGLLDIDLHRYGTERSRDAVRHIRGRLNNPDAIADEKITTLFVDNEDKLWIGTNGSGLYTRVEPTEFSGECFAQYSTLNGLPSDIVLGITQDFSGNLWISTYCGLACMSPDGQVVKYSKNGDLTNDSFYWNASSCDSNGDLLFGTTEGLLAVHGVLPVRTDTGQTVNIAHVWIDNNEVRMGSDGFPEEFSNKKGMKVHESVRTLSFEFAGMDFDDYDSGEYSCLMEGFDNSWIVLDKGRRYVRYTNLPPGDYTLKIRYQRPGQPLLEAAYAELPITVEPYFYKRWWFILFVVLASACLFALFLRLRTASLQRQRAQLQATVAARTAEIEEQKRQVQQLTMDRISFFTNITHEFRTPITLILGPIERALKLSYNPLVIEQLQFVRRNSKYLLSLVNQLMDFRKLESGKMEIMRSRSNLRRFLENLVESFQPLVADRNISLILNERLPKPVMSFDEEALQKVLINLLGNAVKFTPEGGSICVRAVVLPKSCTGGDSEMIYLSVTDSGTGINPDDIPKIFDRFYQGTSPIKYPVAGSSGSGIGLYLCKSLVEIYEGRIFAKNNCDGHGCSFRVLLPLPSGEQAEAEAPALPIHYTGDEPTDTETAPSSDSTKLTVLVVEDNDDMRAFIRSILSPHFLVAEARNGEEALKVLANREIGLIISDLMMPVMDGIELSRKVKENFDISHIPFLMLTAKAGREPRLESYRIGVDEYILKPFDEELLLARIRNILQTRARYQKRFAGHLEVESLNITEDSRDKKFMDQVMKVVEDNYRNSYFEIGDFSEALGVSRSLLNKKLQSIAGQSAGQLLRSYRLNTARNLIIKNRKTRAMNISEIAYEVGFNDSKYFTRCFTKQFNISPSAFLNQED